MKKGSNQENIRKYFIEKKNLQESFLAYIENSEDNNSNFENLIKNIDTQIKQDELERLLLLLLNICNNHHRQGDFFKKIKKIILYLNKEIDFEQTFSIQRILNIFSSNKLILLILFEEKIIKDDKYIFDYFQPHDDHNPNKHCHFFLPEIKKIIEKKKYEQIEDEIKSLNSSNLVNYDEKRRVGENDSQICSLIRNNSLEEFKSFVKQNKISLESEIEPSIFETNSFLLDKTPTLIEYAAFFGSTKIIRYLIDKKVKISEKIWLFAVHSNDIKLINFLEKNHIEPENQNYEECFLESIKCHHNNIAKHIDEKILMGKKNTENYISCSFKYQNYLNFPNKFKSNLVFFYLYKYNYSNIINFFLNSKRKYLRSLTRSNSNQQQIIRRFADKNKLYVVYYLLSKQNEIGNNYFQQCTNLTKIVIPSSITSIGEYSFSECTSLTEILIPSSVTSIGNHSFNECSSLKQITIPSSVKSIGDHSFNGCTQLTQITIPSSVISIGSYSFNGCSSLKQIEIPSSVNSIKSNTFRDCSSLQQILIPSSVTSIEDNAFDGCSSLNKIKLPSSITMIGKGAFYGCIKLHEISLPPITSIKEYTFYGCSSLVQVKIPKSVISIEKKSFKQCLSLIKISIPSSVTSIGNNVFRGCQSLTEILIPSSVTSIGDSAFSGCSRLAQITIPSSVTSIGNNAFNGCSSLTQITIPSSVTSFGEHIFDGIKSLEIKGDIKYIPNKLFSGCSSLKQITIPSSVTEIEDNAFYGCSNSIFTHTCIFIYRF